MIRRLHPYLLGLCLLFLSGTFLNLDAQSINLPPDYDGIEDSSPHGWEPALHCDNSCDHHGSGNYGQQWNTLDNGHPNPDGYGNCFGTGRPTSSCSGFGAGYTDVRHDYCEGEYLIIRTWHIWCNGDLVEHDQRIKVKDVHPPEVNCYGDIHATSGGYHCENEIHIPRPYAHDACSYNLDYKLWFGGEVVLHHDEYFVRNVAEGHHLAKWTVTDDCGNSTECEFYIIVTHGGGTPTAVCVSYINVWINDAYSHVYASSFDDGSNNDCGPVYLKVRREGDYIFDDFVKFDCDDHEQHIAVTLRVYSVDPGPGPVDPSREGPGGDLYGTYNDCWSDAYVRVKDEPHFYCPPDAWITCDEAFDYIDWSHFGTVHAGSNACMMGYYDVHEEIIQPGDCGTYGRHFARIFTVRDHYGHVIWSCTQRIYIKDAGQFFICDTQCKDYPTGSPYSVCHHGGHTLNDGVEWPCDIHLKECGTGLSPEELSNHPDPHVRDNAYPELYGGQCALLAYNYEDQEFSFGSEGCKKIIRTWTVIDWCRFAIERGRNENHFYGKWGYIQIIAVKDEIDPVLYCQDTLDVASLPQINIVKNGDFSEGNTDFSSEYRYGRGTGMYTVDRNAAVLSPYLSGFDHTTGDGRFLMANGDTTQLNVWCQTVYVNPYSTYNFSAWVNNIANPDSSATNEPVIVFTANGREIARSNSLSQSPDEWINVTAPWLSLSSSSVELCAYAETTEELGNNFGIDDISLVATSQCRTNPNNGCEFWANIEIPHAYDDCSEDLKVHWEIDINYYGTHFNADRSGYGGDPSGYFPEGWHRVKWSVRDDCGNKTLCYSIFHVRDCKEPTPYCKNGLATVVMPATGALTIEAWRFDAGSFDNCTPQDELEILIRRSGTNDIFRPTITLGCNDIPDGVAETIYVDILVRDNSGNEDYCTTYVIFQDTPDTDMPQGICPDVDPAQGGIVERSSILSTNDGAKLFEDEGMELYQNTPNPFFGETEISFQISKEQAVQVFVYNISGKVIYQKDIYASAGLNKMTLKNADLGDHAGLLYYRVQTSEQSLTKPMMRIR